MRLLLAPAGLALLAGACRTTPPETTPFGAFVIEREVVVPLDPEAAYSAFTDDIGTWWDHHMSEEPHAVYLEARPGGGFYEVFDETGDGVQHALVTFAKRGEKLVFRGPLGLHGTALDMVHTITFEAEGEGTRVRAEVHGAGELSEDHEAALNRAWDHFLLDRYRRHAAGELGGS